MTPPRPHDGPREPTPQELGYAWDHQVAQLFGGERHLGSGNRPYARLDASASGGGAAVVISGKYAHGASTTMKETDLDEAVRATVGPEAASALVIPIVAYRFRSGRTVGVMDLETLVEWVTAPPQIVEATKQDSIRRTARTPTMLRED